MTDVLVTGMDLKVARVRRMVTQAQLAERMGIHPLTVLRMEQRAVVRPAMADRYHAALATFPSLTRPAEGPEAA